MKNLFSIKISDRDAAELDASPYLAATASPEVKAKMRSAFAIVEEASAPKELTEEEKQLRAKGNRYWAVCLACLAATLVMFFLGGDLGIYTAVPSLYVVNLALLAASIFFNIKAKRINRQQTNRLSESLKLDFSESTARLTEAAAEAARELGVPEDALTTDVLPYHYKEKNGKAVSTNKKGAFSNLAVTVFIKDEKLCDGVHIMAIGAEKNVPVILEKAGIAPDSHCRSGACGFCRSLLLPSTLSSRRHS